jgi:transposase-like protein
MPKELPDARGLGIGISDRRPKVIYRADRLWEARAVVKTCRKWVEGTAIVAAFEQSSQSVERFCAKRGIRPATFRRWRWRLRDSSASSETSSAPSAGDDVRLVPVDVVGLAARAHSRAPVEIAFADVAVRVEPGTDAAYVASLVAELRSRC